MYWMMITDQYLNPEFEAFDQYLFKVYDNCYVLRINIYLDNVDAAKLFNLALSLDCYVEELDMEEDYWQSWIKDNFLEDGLSYLSDLLSVPDAS